MPTKEREIDSLLDATQALESVRMESAAPQPAFEDVYRMYKDRVYWYALRRAGHPDDAADLTQTIFTKAYRAIGQFEPDKGQIGAWLFAIASNSASSFIGRKGRAISWAEMPEGYADSIPDPDMGRGAVPHGERLRRSLARLDSQSQELLLLRFEAELSVSEIATVVGKADEATKKALQRALKKLKDIYDDEPEHL